VKEKEAFYRPGISMMINQEKENERTRWTTSVNTLSICCLQVEKRKWPTRWEKKLGQVIIVKGDMGTANGVSNRERNRWKSDKRFVVGVWKRVGVREAVVDSVHEAY
jgi:hypothetical protein